MRVISRKINWKSWATFGLISGCVSIILISLILALINVLLISVVNTETLLGFLTLPIDLGVFGIAIGGAILLAVLVVVLMQSVIFWIIAGVIYKFTRSLIVHFNMFWQLFILGFVLSLILSFIFSPSVQISSLLGKAVYLSINIFLTIALMKRLGLRKVIPIR